MRERVAFGCPAFALHVDHGVTKVTTRRGVPTHTCTVHGVILDNSGMGTFFDIHVFSAGMTDVITDDLIAVGVIGRTLAKTAPVTDGRTNIDSLAIGLRVLTSV